MKYHLQDFNNILFDGFDFKLPDETVHLISVLALEVGSPTYIKTPVFKKREGGAIPPEQGYNVNSDIRRVNKKKNVETVHDADWESLRSFHATKLEQKVGIDAKIDAIRSHLNKMSDKNFVDLKNKIIGIIDELIEQNRINNEINQEAPEAPEEQQEIGNLTAVSSAIFDIASNNRFYSKIYADLYSDLMKKYETHGFMAAVFEKSFHSFMDVFNTIEYVDPEKNYDLFCKNNKDNEKRKALSAFFVNLTLNGVIPAEQLIAIVRQLLNQVLQFMAEENKKNIVDELTENIAILCSQKHVFHNQTCILSNGLTIDEVVAQLANSKSKSFPSLSNKSIFKYMDMIDM